MSFEFIVQTHSEMFDIIKNKDYKNVVHVVDKSYSWWREILHLDK